VNADGTDMVPAFEILVNSLAMANTIRAEEYHKIPSLIATGGLQGMQTMEICLRAMAASKKITSAQAEELIAEEA
jgi:Tfp pilus assembly pilus retraction ATPase PilT